MTVKANNIYTIKIPELKRIMVGIKKSIEPNREQEEKCALWEFKKGRIDIISYNQFTASIHSLITEENTGRINCRFCLPTFEMSVSWLSNKRHCVDIEVLENGIKIIDHRDPERHNFLIKKYNRKDYSKFDYLKEMFNNIKGKKASVSRSFNGDLFANAISTIKTPFDKRSDILVNIYDNDSPIYVAGLNEERIIMPL